MVTYEAIKFFKKGFLRSKLGITYEFFIYIGLRGTFAEKYTAGSVALRLVR